MSKAFTKEDDDAGFRMPEATAAGVPEGPLRLTSRGARLLAARREPNAALATALARAEVLPQTPASPPRAALGVTVHVEDDGGRRRALRLVTPEEFVLLGEGCSVASPLGRALLGAAPGDVRTATLPRGPEELEVVALEGEADAPPSH